MIHTNPNDVLVLVKVNCWLPLASVEVAIRYPNVGTVTEATTPPAAFSSSIVLSDMNSWNWPG